MGIYLAGQEYTGLYIAGQDYSGLLVGGEGYLETMETHSLVEGGSGGIWGYYAPLNYGSLTPNTSSIITGESVQIDGIYYVASSRTLIVEVAAGTTPLNRPILLSIDGTLYTLDENIDTINPRKAGIADPFSTRGGTYTVAFMMSPAPPSRAVELTLVANGLGSFGGFFSRRGTITPNPFTVDLVPVRAQWRATDTRGSGQLLITMASGRLTAFRTANYYIDTGAGGQFRSGQLSTTGRLAGFGGGSAYVGSTTYTITISPDPIP